MKLKFKYLSIFYFLCCTSFAQVPILNDDVYNTSVETAIDINAANGLLQNDSDPNGDSISVIEFIIDGEIYPEGTSVDMPEGTIVINSNGSFTFTPAAEFSGSLPLIVYVVSDGNDISFGNLFIKISNGEALTAQNYFDTADKNNTLTKEAPGLLANDSFSDLEDLSIALFTINGQVYSPGESANLSEGTFTLNDDGSYEFVPAIDFTGAVPEINYTILEGLNTSTASLFLTVEDPNDLIRLSISSCNQGFTTDNTYKIKYSVVISNLSDARDYHSNNVIKNLDLTQELEAILSSECLLGIDDASVSTTTVTNFVNNSYPSNYGTDSVNQDFFTGNSTTFFSQASINNDRLYPRQNISIQFCVVVEPFCGGRPNPTPSGSGVDFDADLDLSSSAGDVDANLLLQDFHTTESFLSAGFFVQETSPDLNPDLTLDFNTSFKISNEGNTNANNINFNLGLGHFLDNGIVFNSISIGQSSGSPVSINSNYDGDSETLLLQPNNSLAPGETIILDIAFEVQPLPGALVNYFYTPSISQSQGSVDGYDEDTPDYRRSLSYVVWEDALGNHLDRYYVLNSLSDDTNSDQCSCSRQFIRFQFNSEAQSSKEISGVDANPNGILEHEELTFELKVTNTSPILDLFDLQIQDDLSAVCTEQYVSFSPPTISSSTATQVPNLNPNYDGINDLNIFDGSSGLLKPDEYIVVELKAVFVEDCFGTNSFSFESTNIFGITVESNASAVVIAFTDTDMDNISNVDDIDDDNDTILDFDETNQNDPLLDHDGDLIPNYRDVDFGVDADNNGIVDSFDFDSDGIPNHLDLDSDNDGIYDIYEVNNYINDNNADGRTDEPTSINGLDDSLETDDTFDAEVTYLIPMSDADVNPDYLDIDSDADGIVDLIEAQSTEDFIVPSNTYLDNGLDTAYPDGIVPIDTDEDGIPDFLDINADNDFEDDFVEGWDVDNDEVTETDSLGIDVDNDGLDDGYDNDNAAVNPSNGQTPFDFPNADYDVTVERDWREVNVINLKIDDASTIEGDDLLFTISLVKYSDNTSLSQSSSPVEFTLSTIDGAEDILPEEVATQSLDYGAIPGLEAVIPPLTSTYQVLVDTNDDNISELDEFLTLKAEINTSNTANVEALGIGTILDNESLPSISMNHDTVSEGEELVYNVTIDRPSSRPTKVFINTFENTAISPEDYQTISDTITIDATILESDANLSTSFIIPTYIDNMNEMDSEFLNVTGTMVSNNIGETDLLKTGTILDIDPEPNIVITNDTVFEGNTLQFTISLENSDGELMSNYLPIDFELETLDVTTTVDLDYPYLYDFRFIPAGESKLLAEVPTLNDNLNELNEFVNLSATIISGTISNTSNILMARGTIIDEDIPNLFTPNNDGQSDVFRIENLTNYPDFKIVILNRTGDEIYNYSNNGRLSPLWWDGTNNGKPVIEGVYFYELDYNNGVRKPVTGFIQLVR